MIFSFVCVNVPEPLVPELSGLSRLSNDTSSVVASSPVGVEFGPAKEVRYTIDHCIHCATVGHDLNKR